MTLVSDEDFMDCTHDSTCNHENIGKFMSCDYALLADKTFNMAEFLASEEKSSSNVKIE